MTHFMSESSQESEGKISSRSSDDEVQKVAEIKEYLEAKISDLEIELKKLRDMLVLVDANLREKSFVPAIALSGAGSAVMAESEKALATANAESEDSQHKQVRIPPTAIKADPERTNERQLRRTKDSMVLANALVDQDKVVIVPSKEVKLSQHTPPFQSFFVNRILRGYQTKDEEESKNGKLRPNQVLQYNVQETQGTISSVTISNYRDTARLNEILSTITWAFTRMLEKK
jgi:hypothetical protein